MQVFLNFLDNIYHFTISNADKFHINGRSVGLDAMFLRIVYYTVWY